MGNNYSKAYTEVLEIISHFSREEYSKIPKEKIEFYEKNKDRDYQFKINPEVDLSEQNISREANAIIITLFRDYFATDKQKEKLEEILKSNEKRLEEIKRKKYNPDDIFKNTVSQKTSEDKQSNLPVEEKKSNFFTRFLNYIKSLFNRMH